MYEHSSFPQVLWAQQMFRKVRVKRWIVPGEEPSLDRIRSLDDEDLLEYIKFRFGRRCEHALTSEGTEKTN